MSPMEGGLESGKGVLAIERRKHERFDVEFPLDYSRIDDKEKYEGLAANASEKGEFLSIFPNDWRWGRY